MTTTSRRHQCGGSKQKHIFGAWRNLSVRKVCITTGEKPAEYGLKRPEIQALLADVAPASDEMTLQLTTLRGFHVATYMAEGDHYRLAAKTFLLEQMEITVEVMPAVVRNSVTPENSVDRISMLDHGLREDFIPWDLLPQAPGEGLLA